MATSGTPKLEHRAPLPGATLAPPQHLGFYPLSFKASLGVLGSPEPAKTYRLQGLWTALPLKELSRSLLSPPCFTYLSHTSFFPVFPECTWGLSPPHPPALGSSTLRLPSAVSSLDAEAKSHHFEQLAQLSAWIPVPLRCGQPYPCSSGSPKGCDLRAIIHLPFSLGTPEEGLSLFHMWPRARRGSREDMSAAWGLGLLNTSSLHCFVEPHLHP